METDPLLTAFAVKRDLEVRWNRTATRDIFFEYRSIIDMLSETEEKLVQMGNRLAALKNASPLYS